MAGIPISSAIVFAAIPPGVPKVMPPSNDLLNAILFAA
jgi:hypothetical protein